MKNLRKCIAYKVYDDKNTLKIMSQILFKTFVIITLSISKYTYSEDKPIQKVTLTITRVNNAR